MSDTDFPYGNRADSDAGLLIRREKLLGKMRPCFMNNRFTL